MRVFGISGSLRAHLAQHGTVRATQKLQPGTMTIEIYNGLRDIPPVDDPAAVMAAADPPRTSADAASTLE